MTTDNSTPAISILTTCYNREKYLAECIQSVLDGHFQDFELIIVDDGSTDRSVEIAKDFASKDNRIRVYENEVNLGDYPNRNKAASYAKGKYLKYLDADDMHGRFTIDMMVDAMESNPEAGIGFFDHSRNKPLFPLLLQPAQTYQAHYSKNHAIFHRSPLNVIIRKDVFMEIGGFTGNQHVGDFELWHLICSVNPTVIIGSGLGFWRSHEDQQSVDNRTDPTVPFKYLCTALYFLSHPENPLPETVANGYISKFSKTQARAILYSFIRNGYHATLKLKKMSSLSWADIIRNSILPT